MISIFKNMIPYWRSMILIILLLIVQAFCDLSLPTYTADIIDVGIQNRGVEHILPERITQKEYGYAKLFMTDEEAAAWDDCYDAEEEGIYVRRENDGKVLDELDETLAAPLVLNYQMSAVDEASFKEYIARAQGIDPSALESMTIEQIGNQMGMDLETFTREKENEEGETVDTVCVDMRPVLQEMLDAGAMDQDSVMEMRESLQKMIDTMGSSLMESTGVAYALECDEQAGMNVDQIQKSYLWKEGFSMVGFAAVSVACAILVSFFAARIGAGVGRTLRGSTFKTVLGFSNGEMNRFSTASLITRTTNDVQQIQLVTALFLRMILYAPVLGIGGVIKVLQTGANMGWTIVLAVIVIVGFIGILVSIAMPKFKIMQKLVDNLNLVSREILTGLQVIRAFGREKTEEERFDKANKALTRTTLFTNRVMAFMMPGMMALMNGITILIMWVASRKIDDGVMQVGAMTAFITYAMMIVMAFLMLTMMSILLPRAGVAAERIAEVNATPSALQDPAQPKDISGGRGVVCFQNVNFRYPGGKEDALHDISFTAEPGKTTAIIGSTGSGKSTIVNLIPRLYDVTEGSITVDGVDIREVKMKDLREEIGFVPQKGILFSGTIASNLRFGNRDATDEEIQEAARIAQATEFIEEKDRKYDSEISQGGTNVSGGQKQRLAIARAIAKNPKIFVFDDSFSALDLKTDAALRKALAQKVKDRTVIIVAQRISTIMHADQILVLDEGRIAGAGTHRELLKNCEVYMQIARSQLSEKELQMETIGKEEA